MDYRTARVVLGTKPTSTYTQIKSAYRERARKLHPDLNKSPGSPARFSTLVHAYRVLMEYRSPFQARRYNSKSHRCGRGLVKVGLIFLFFSLIAQAADVKLTWNANSEADLAGYKLYQGIGSGVYGTPTTVGKVSTHTVTGLSAGTYYFALTAFDTSGNESGKSNEVSKVVVAIPPPPPPPPSSESPSGTTIPPALQITDAGGAVWTVGVNLYGRGPIPIRNSVNVAAGTWGCSKVLYQGSVVYCYGAQGWIRWTGTAWITGSPSTPPPPPPPPPPVTSGPAITLTSPATRTMSLTRRTDNTGTSLPLTVNKDDCVRYNGVKVAGGLNCP